MGVIIAGERSGVGKTTITLAILAYLKSQNRSLQSFKVGPDYIDPMYHTAITGKPCRNLDPILTSDEYVRWCFDYHSQDVSLSVVEGVMGLFDGVPAPAPDNDCLDYASTAYIARLLNLPVVLVIDCSRLSISIGAIVRGYQSFDCHLNIVGVILNKVASPKHLSLLKAGLAPLDISIMGVWCREQLISLPSRHLGLIPTEEVDQYQQVFHQLATLAEKNINWELLLPYIENGDVTPADKDDRSNKLNVVSKSNKKSIPYFIESKKKYPCKIGIARDKSFNFYYQDNLDILEYLGAELIFFSPLVDAHLPDDLDALYFGGGFPEVFAEQLAQNYSLKSAIRKVINQGLPTYAECGGMMYLSESIVDFAGKNWEMVGILPNQASMSKKLTLGYRQATTNLENQLLQKDIYLQGHEFHHAIDSHTPTEGIINLIDYYTQTKLPPQGWQIDNIYASYLHLHFGNIIPQVEYFLQGIINFNPT